MGEKKVNGRKRQILVDSMGLLLRVLVQPADMYDGDGGKELLERYVRDFPTLKKLWADSHYSGLVDWARDKFGIELEIVRKLADQKGFVVLPRRWVVERSFAWFGRNRRLSKDYECDPLSSVGFMYLASIHLLIRRVCPT